jgi:hypothetical protein
LNVEFINIPWYYDHFPKDVSSSKFNYSFFLLEKERRLLEMTEVVPCEKDEESNSRNKSNFQ